MSSTELNFLMDALRPYSENLTLLGASNPYQLSLNGVLYSVHVGLIHDSGNERPNEDESRIQLSRANRETQKFRSGEFTPLFIGFFSKSYNKHKDNIAVGDGLAFSAWNPEHALAKNDKDTGALYGRFSHEQKALSLGAAIYTSRSNVLKRNVNTISMRAKDLGFYMENAGALHNVNSAAEIQEAVAALEPHLGPSTPGTRAVLEITVAGHKEKVSVTRTAYPRDPKFSRDVLSAYGHACAVCGRQLGLVQAAHIIPHNDDDCPNDVTNGIALCVEHHKLYDDALLLPAPDGRLYLNPERVEHLENIGQGAGLDDVRSRAQKQFNRPNDPAQQPNEDYLRRGIRIRLGQGDRGGPRKG